MEMENLERGLMEEKIAARIVKARTKASKTIAKTIVFDIPMLRKVEELAFENYRSFTAQVTFMLESCLEKREKKPVEKTQ